MCVARPSASQEDASHLFPPSAGRYFHLCWHAPLAAACTFLAWAGAVFELVFPAVLFVSGASWIFVALAVLFHVGNSVLFRIFFPNVWLLALFVDWDGWRRGVVSRR